jgi:hypothetical protein
LYLGWADCCASVAGGGYATGGTIETAGEMAKVYLVRYDASGDTLWTREFGDASHFWTGQQVKQTSDGGFLICGFTDASGYHDGFALKTDSLGNEQWRQTYGLGGVVLDSFSSVVELSNGYLLTGMSYIGLDNSEMFAVRTDLLGNELWTQRWGGPYDDSQVHASLSPTGQILLAGGYAYGLDGYLRVPYLALMDSASGELLWEHQYGPPVYSSLFFAAKSDAQGGIYACGLNTVDGQELGLLMRADAQGDSLWMRNYWYYDSLVPQGQGRFWDVLPTADKGCIATGFTLAPFSPPVPPDWSQDAWVVKVDSMGCIVPGCNGLTGITSAAINMQQALQIYPNPAHGRLQVQVALPQGYVPQGSLSLTITTASGQVLRREDLPAGNGQSLELDLHGLAPGLYSLHLADAANWLAGQRFVVQ